MLHVGHLNGQISIDEILKWKVDILGVDIVGVDILGS